MKALSVCLRLLRNVTQRLKNIVVVGCISLYHVKADGKKHLCASATENQPTSSCGPPLPDDVLEMILLRLPLSSLMVARCVCRTWRYMMTTPSFIQMWYQTSCHTPWLFLFGGAVRAFDVSLGQWHQSNHVLLKKRDLFSVVSVGYEVYIIGGRFLEGDRLKLPPSDVSYFFKYYNGVSVFNPLTGCWREAAPMKSPRMAPALGVIEVPMVSDFFKGALNCHANENVQKRDNHVKSIIIAVGGLGPKNQPLDTCEIYDPQSNRWIDIGRLPGDLGAVCSGVVCGGGFYVYSKSHKLASYFLERGYWVTIQISQPGRGINLKVLCCSGRLFLFCVIHTEHGPGGMVERQASWLREIVLPLSNGKEAVLLSTWNARDSEVSFTSERDRMYSYQRSRTIGMVVHSIDCLHGILIWGCLTEKTVNDSPFPGDLVCMLHL